MPDSSAPTPATVDPARYPDLCEICARHGRHDTRYPHQTTTEAGGERIRAVYRCPRHAITWICWWATHPATA